MPKSRMDGTTPSSIRREQPDLAHAEATTPGTDTGYPLVLICDMRPSVREALAAQVVMLLPGARVHAGSPQNAPGAPVLSGAFAPDPSGMPVPAPRLVVRLVGVDAAVPSGWENAQVVEVRPRDVDEEDVPAAVQPHGTGTSGPAHASGYVDLADVALALARCGQLHRVDEPGMPPGQRLSGAALIAAMPEMLRPLLPGVWRTAEALTGQAGDALLAGDMALLARVAHTVRGMAANYAMPEWAACAAALECSARYADRDTASDALAWLRAALSALSVLLGQSGQPNQPNQPSQPNQPGQSGQSGQSDQSS